MFEIIMLFAFLWAATSQLLPGKRVTTRVSCRKTGPDKKDRKRHLHAASQKTEKKPVKAKSRNHNYACAA